MPSSQYCAWCRWGGGRVGLTPSPSLRDIWYHANVIPFYGPQLNPYMHHIT